MEQKHIDSLLERYLNLLDEYSRLREELSKLQAGVFQNIARANFAGERGMRYGQDHYDERMCASRLLDISPGADDVPEFTIKNVKSATEDGGQKEDETREDGPDEDKADTTTARENSEASPEETQGLEDKDEDKEKQGKKKAKKATNNPLHWFGLLAPAPLRTAQTLSIQAVEQVIPRLISVNAEMEHVEIEIRRARKKRAKAAAATEKEPVGMEAVEAM
ncbi:hypothetical protein V8C35DRAFT_301023 [Trichoderma chlorosporum]